MLSLEWNKGMWQELFLHNRAGRDVVTVTGWVENGAVNWARKVWHFFLNANKEFYFYVFHKGVFVRGVF